MDTLSGADLHGGDEASRKAAASLMGSARSERKAAAARATAAKRAGVPLSEEHKAKIRAAQQAKWEEKRQAQEAGGPVDTAAAPTEKRRPGRPKKETAATSEPASAPKRGRGRPRKEQAQ